MSERAWAPHPLDGGEPVPGPSARLSSPGDDSARRSARHENLAVPALTGLATLLVTLAVLPASPGRGDSAELTLALALAGIPHPTGYPLYILLGHPFVRLMHALGLGWPAAANAWSAVAAAAATALVARLGLELATLAAPGLRGPLRRLVAIAPAALVALDPLWLVAASQAEVHAMWYALTAGAALFVLLELRRLDEVREAQAALAIRPAKGPGADARAALAWGAVCGASLAHHATSVLILLPLTAALALAAARAGRWRASLPGLAAAAAAVPLACYAFVAYRAFHVAPVQWPIDPSWAGVWRHVSGSLYARYLGGFAPLPEQLALIREGALPFLLALPLVVVWGLRAGARPLRAWLLAMATACALLTGFVLGYRVPDPAAYFVVPMMLGSLIAIPALSWAAARVPAAWTAALVFAGLGAVAAWSLPRAFAERDQLTVVDHEVRAAWRAIPFDQGIVLWLGDKCARLEILRTLEGERPGLYVVNPNLLTWPASRTRFIRRFGFDPLDRAYANYWAELPGVLRDRTGLPVVDFGDVLRGRGVR